MNSMRRAQNVGGSLIFRAYHGLDRIKVRILSASQGLYLQIKIKVGTNDAAARVDELASSMQARGECHLLLSPQGVWLRGNLNSKPPKVC